MVNKKEYRALDLANRSVYKVFSTPAPQKNEIDELHMHPMSVELKKPYSPIVNSVEVNCIFKKKMLTLLRNKSIGLFQFCSLTK